MTMIGGEHNWVIKPFVGVGPLTFGLSRQEVRALLGTNYHSFRQGPFATNETDAFDDLGLHTDYDANDKLEFVEGQGNTKLLFNGVSFLEESIFDVLQRQVVRKLNYLYENGLYIFGSAGFSLYVEDDLVKSVGVFRRGYYN
jgi:hypothetical protein